MSDSSWTLNISEDVFIQEDEYLLKPEPELSWIDQEQEHTAWLCAASWPSMMTKVKNMLKYMEIQGINLPLILDALSWGHPDFEFCKGHFDDQS